MRATEGGTKALSANREPMDKIRIEGAAGQGERARKGWAYLLGWKAYFGLAQTPHIWQGLDEWLRHRLWAIQLTQRGRPTPRTHSAGRTRRGGRKGLRGNAGAGGATVPSCSIAF